MSEFEAEYEQKGVAFLAVNAFEDPARGRAFIAESGLDYRWLWADTAALEALGVAMVPAQIILDRDGKVAWVSGLFSVNEGAAAIREALDEVLGG
jgi:peroxiredoxin